MTLARGLAARQLLQDHQRALETAGHDLRTEIYSDNSITLLHRFRCFEHAITEHLDVEERELLPAFSEHAPEDARQIQLQHRELRDRLYHVGVDVELHRVRAAHLESLVGMLQRSLAFEATTLYPWAETHAASCPPSELFDRLARSLRRLANLPRRAA